MAWSNETSYRETKGKNRSSAQWPQNAEEHESLGKLLGELASQSASLVRDEVALAQQEIREKLKTVQAAALMVIAGSALFLVSLLAFCTALIAALSAYLNLWQAALVVGAGIAIIASLVTFMGVGQFKRAKLRPQQTIETLEENKEWLKEIS